MYKLEHITVSKGNKKTFKEKGNNMMLDGNQLAILYGCRETPKRDFLIRKVFVSKILFPK